MGLPHLRAYTLVGLPPLDFTGVPYGTPIWVHKMAPAGYCWGLMLSPFPAYGLALLAPSIRSRTWGLPPMRVWGLGRESHQVSLHISSAPAAYSCTCGMTIPCYLYLLHLLYLAIHLWKVNEAYICTRF